MDTQKIPNADKLNALSPICQFVQEILDTHDQARQSEIVAPENLAEANSTILRVILVQAQLNNVVIKVQNMLVQLAGTNLDKNFEFPLNQEVLDSQVAELRYELLQLVTVSL